MSKFFLWVLLAAMHLPLESYSCKCKVKLNDLPTTAELNSYTFIGVVRIKETVGTAPGQPMPGNFRNTLHAVEVVQVFKGDTLTVLADETANTSCDLGLQKNEEWIVFGRKMYGYITITACQWDEQYRDDFGTREWQYATATKLYQHLCKEFGIKTRSKQNGVFTEYYPNNKPEYRVTLKNGKLHGERLLWYSNGNLLSKQFYQNDTITGKSYWYFHSGQLMREEEYAGKRLVNVYREYFDTTHMYVQYVLAGIKDKQKITRELLIKNETLYDTTGRCIYIKEFSGPGKLLKMYYWDKNKNQRVMISYNNHKGIADTTYNY